jgi:chemotaxis signal transduction protein
MTLSLAHQSLLEHRARRLAERPEAVCAVSFEALLVEAGGERHALELDALHSVLNGLVTPLPGVNAPVVGIFNVRGEVVAVFDLAQVLRLPVAAPNLEQAQALVLLRGPHGLIGLRVERLLGMQTFSDAPEDSLEARTAVRGVIGDVVVLEVTGLLEQIGIAQIGIAQIGIAQIGTFQAGSR